MRTLSRPMFNMGGPIKQGIMHGIREPHNSGGRIGLNIGGGINAARWLASQAAKTFGKVGGSYNLGKIGGSGAGRNLPMVIKQPGWGARIAEKWKGMPSWFKSSVERDPSVRLGKAAYEGRGLLGKPLKWTGKQLAPPTGLLGAGYIGSQFIGGDDAADSDAVTGVMKPGGYPKAKTTKEAQAKFAAAQRDTRVQRYLDLMGYDRAKKTAVADALIDASKIVSDRGTLDRKNITGELINPAIQALSKRLDKPDQIREAVGLMMVKGEIEKDLEDPSIKALRLEQLKAARGGFSKDIGDFVLSAKGQKIKPEALKRYARAKADQHGLDFTVVTDEMIAGAGEGASEDAIIQSVVKGDGVYMIGDAIVQVTGGVPKRIA